MEIIICLLASKEYLIDNLKVKNCILLSQKNKLIETCFNALVPLKLLALHSSENCNVGCGYYQQKRSISSLLSSAVLESIIIFQSFHSQPVF